MRAHVIANGSVVNTVEVDTLDDLPDLIAAETGGIGWQWDGNTLTPPPAPPAPTKVPEQVEMRQARLALDAARLLDDVDAAVQAAGRAAQIEWEFALTVQRSHPLIAFVQARNGLSDAQIDGLFIDAAGR